MNAPEALRAARVLGAKRMLPIHYDTFSASFEPAGRAGRQLVEESARLGMDAAVTVLPQGGSLYLKSEPPMGPAGPSRSARESTTSTA
jgi:L-ascorbate metabolism protein UlaG (beta-lactamase superfamily)